MYLRIKGPVVPELRDRADAMDEGIAVRREQFAYLEEVFIKMADADMLHHADRNHPVKLAGEVAIIQLRNVTRSETPAASACSRAAFHLLGRNIDGGDMGASFARQMNGEAAPAGADLSDSHTGF